MGEIVELGLLMCPSTCMDTLILKHPSWRRNIAITVLRLSRTSAHNYEVQSLHIRFVNSPNATI